MLKNRWFVGVLSVIVFTLGFLLGGHTEHLRGHRVLAQAGKRVFELRTYTTTEGGLEALSNRFRDHTMQLFERHGMTNIGYFIPQGSQDTFIYILAHSSREAADKSWAAFRNDPERARVFAESEINGKLIANVGESIWADPTDYSPLK